MTAVDVIISYLRQPIDCHVPDAQRKEAEAIVKALHDAGYVITKNRMDPEGGIPGRR